MNIYLSAISEYIRIAPHAAGLFIDTCFPVKALDIIRLTSAQSEFSTHSFKTIEDNV